MHQKLLPGEADTAIRSDNISIPIGLAKVFGHFFRITGIDGLLNGFKTKGIPLSPLVRAMCIHSLDEGDNSLQSCADWLSDKRVRKLLGIKGEVSQRTLNRALNLLGQHREEIIVRLYRGIGENFDIPDEAVAVDGSAVARSSYNGDLAGMGHPRDKNEGLQTEFMVAVYQETGIPFYIAPFSGEKSDEEQYAKTLPEIISLIDHGTLDAYADVIEEWKPPSKRRKNEQIRPFKKDADLASIRDGLRKTGWIVMDNGGSSAYNTSLIVGLGRNYLTRVKMNNSDSGTLSEGIFTPVEPGVYCCKHVFANGKTNYLFFNEALFAKKYRTAERKYDRLIQVTDDIRSGKIRNSDLISKKTIPGVDYDVTVTVQNVIAEFDEEGREAEIRKLMGHFAGFFKLQSSVELTAKEALNMYRHRVVVEQLISALKQTAGIKPMRVWNEDSINGTMVLALLAQAVLAMARFGMEPKETKQVRHGLTIKRMSRPSTKTIAESLRHLTLTEFRDEKGRYRQVYSNWEAVSEEIFDGIEAFLMFGKHWKSKIPRDSPPEPA